MKALASIGLAAGLALSLAAANATPTLVGTTTDPTGINDLVVDGTTYDVTFSLTTLNSFIQGTTLSVDAESALVSALNALSVTGLGNATPSVDYLIDVDNSLGAFQGPLCLNIPSCAVGDWATSLDILFPGLGLIINGTIYLEAADFSEVPTTGVPEPFTLSLFGAGLLGMAAMRRRKKSTA